MITIIKNGKIVTPDAVEEGKTVVIEDDRIKEICTDYEGKADCVMDAEGGYIMPGFIDVHSDKIEQVILPRPTAQIDFGLALAECEKELLGLGITTVYHSLSLYKDEFFGKSPLRTKENVQKMAELIQDIHEKEHLIHHRFHLRLEIDNFAGFDIAKSMIDENMVNEISFMDHTPGQGQYRDLMVYQEAVEKYQGREIKEQGMEAIIDYHKNKDRLSFEQLRELSAYAAKKGITTASHDDDCVEKLEVNGKIGVAISEFPITIDVAREAHNRGFYTVVGAPNVLLGGSHSGNMSAAEAMKDGCADIICSDYFPQAILHSIFIMAKQYGCSLPEIVKKATLNPAKAMKIDADYGSIEAGKKADILIVAEKEGRPAVTGVLVDGEIELHVAFRSGVKVRKDPILKIENLSKNFYLHNAAKEIHSCQNINFTLEEGKFIGIVGLSGAGKSTILKCMNRTYLASEGKILYNSERFGEIDLVTATEREILYLRKNELGYVSQFLNVMPRTTARQHVMNAVLETSSDEKEAWEKAEEMLDYFRLPKDLWDLYPNTFSGGERLRLNLAHTMVKKPRLMLLDEPTASLDPKTKILVKDMLIKLKKKGTSMIGIFHDLEFMDGVCDQVFNITKGEMQ